MAVAFFGDADLGLITLVTLTFFGLGGVVLDAFAVVLDVFGSGTFGGGFCVQYGEMTVRKH